MTVIAPCFCGSSEIEGLGVILWLAGDVLKDLSVSLFICCFPIPTEHLPNDNYYLA